MKLTLRQKINEGGGVYSFIFEPDQPIGWQAGQYLRLHLPHQNSDDRGEYRFFSISAAPFEKMIRITTRMAPEKGSSFKKALLELALGSQIEGIGPRGDFLLNPSVGFGYDRKYAFLAGGIGITPFRSILLELVFANLPVDVVLLYANRTNEIVFKDEFEALRVKNPKFRVEYIVEPLRLDEQIIKEKVPDFLERVFYVSGPEPMVEAMDKILAGINVPEGNIKNDFFPNYDWP